MVDNPQRDEALQEYFRGVGDIMSQEMFPRNLMQLLEFL